jgi:uncharacterized protein YkwD
MNYNKLMSKLVSGALAITLSVTSLGGLAAAKELTAPTSEEIQETTVDNTQVNKTLLGGLLAIGLISALTNSGSKGTTSETPAKSSTPGTQAPSSPSASVSASLTTDEKLAFDLMNADRQANGLPALKLNMNIVKVARVHGQDMINRKFFAHENPDGQSPFDRMQAAGISFRYAGENLAINRSVTAAEQAFMNSSGHRANILNPNYTEVGIGVRYDAAGSVYVVQNFISR